MHIDPGVDGLAKVLDLGCFAGFHNAAISGLERGTDDVGVDLPVSPLVDIRRRDSAAAKCLIVRKGNDPVAIEAEDAFLNLAEKASELRIAVVGLAPATALSFGGCTGAGGRGGHRWQGGN